MNGGIAPWRPEFDEQGFAIVRGLFDRDEMAEVSSAFDRLLVLARTEPDRLLARAPTEPDPLSARFVVDRDPFRLHRVVWCGGAEPALAKLGDDPRFLGLAAAALESSELVQLIQQAHFKIPGDGVGFGWHQDASNRRYGSEEWTDVDGRGSFVQIALAVDAMTPDAGPLRMVPGSHRLGFLADPFTGALPEDDLPLDQAVDVLLEPGDVAVFGPFVVHGSAANTGPRPRRLLLQGYALPGANHRVYPGCGLGVPRTAHTSAHGAL